ncbi:MAG: hypothetical protein KGD67_12345, partial [Candidatus Lokiarchaeota archaeon]|nr:hypothetical protein [Candidatus Lokiarchaeota archaeon]
VRDWALPAILKGLFPVLSGLEVVLSEPICTPSTKSLTILFGLSNVIMNTIDNNNSIDIIYNIVFPFF